MQIRFLPSGNSDAIIVHFQDREGVWRNLCIDSGFPKTYAQVLKKELTFIAERGERVDLWVITHIDSDHIGGVLSFLKDPDFHTGFVTEFWFNPSMAIVPSNSNKISVKQGIQLRDHLIKTGRCQPKTYCTDQPSIDFFGTSITILSPDQKKLDAAFAAWDKKEKVHKSGKPISKYFDYNEPIEVLMKRPFIEDASIWNGSSIAFLLKIQGKRILFLGDSHPSVVATHLRTKFDCSPQNPLLVDLVKVSHHGSAGNTSPELLELIDCSRFAFCAIGKGCPAKAALVRIAASRISKVEPTVFLFNHPTPKYTDLFHHELEAAEKLNFRIEHLSNGFFEF